MEVRRIGDTVLVLVPRLGLDQKTRHVHNLRVKKELIAPSPRVILPSHEIPSNPSNHHEMISAPSFLPLRLTPQKLHEFDPGAVPRRQIVIPDVSGHVEARIERNVKRRCFRRVWGEASVALHPLVKDHLRSKLIGIKP